MNSLAKTLIISLTTLIVIAIIAVVVVFYINHDSVEGKQEADIDELNENSYQTPEVTTDLIDGRFVRIQFQLITDGKKALKELEKRDFQIQNILIKELSVMTEEDFNEGLANLENTLKIELNKIMTDGEVVDVYTINKIMQ